MWFGFNYTKTSVADARPKFNLNFLSGDYKGPSTFKFAIFPIKKNELIVRFENVGDIFDSTKSLDPANSTYYVKVKDFAE